MLLLLLLLLVLPAFKVGAFPSLLLLQWYNLSAALFGVLFFCCGDVVIKKGFMGETGLIWVTM